ncbi:MAG: hypothetical protein IJ859_09985 [Synergistaceae bacterium]|nr:hypothetical protein [Synergistaceae bacterium]MBR2209121.1 hypothetical protein [Synergistaceae bacterium]
MCKSQNGYYKSLERVANLIELLISCHPQGFSILLGEAESPDSKMIHEMMNTKRVPMPDDFKPTTRSDETEAERIVYDREYFDESVKLAGGWAHVNLATQDFKKADKRYWGIVVDYVKFVSNPTSRYLSKLNFVATRYGVSTRTVTRYRQEFANKLAYVILLPDSERSEFCARY